MKNTKNTNKCDTGLKVQSLIFDKNYYTENKAKEWAKSHGYISQEPDIKENTIRIRQRNPEDFNKDIFRTILFGKGIKAVVACLKDDKYENGGDVEKPFLKGYRFKDYADMIASIKNEQNTKIDISENIQTADDLIDLLKNYIEKIEELENNYLKNDGLYINHPEIHYLRGDVNQVIEKLSKEYKLTKKQIQELKEEFDEDWENRCKSFITDEYYQHLDDWMNGGQEKDWVDLNLFDENSIIYTEDGIKVNRGQPFGHVWDLESWIDEFEEVDGKMQLKDGGYYDEWIAYEYRNIQSYLDGVDYYEYGLSIFEEYMLKRLENYENFALNNDMEHRIEEYIHENFKTRKKENGGLAIDIHKQSEICKSGLQVQTLIFDKNYYTENKAKEWAKSHGYSSQESDIKENTIRLRQSNPDNFLEGKFRTINFRKGIKAVLGCPKSDKYADGGKTSNKYLYGYDFENYDDMINALKEAKQQKIDISEYIQDEKELCQLIVSYLDKRDEKYYGGYTTIVPHGETYFSYDEDIVVDTIKADSPELKIDGNKEKEIKEYISKNQDWMYDSVDSDYYDERYGVFSNEQLQDFIDLDIIDKNRKQIWKNADLIVSNNNLLDYYFVDLENLFEKNFAGDCGFAPEDEVYFDEWLGYNYTNLKNILSEIDFFLYSMEVLEAYVDYVKDISERDSLNEYMIDEVYEFIRKNNKEEGWEYLQELYSYIDKYVKDNYATKNYNDMVADCVEYAKENIEYEFDYSVIDKRVKEIIDSIESYTLKLNFEKGGVMKQQFDVGQVESYAKQINDLDKKMTKQLASFRLSEKIKFPLYQAELDLCKKGLELLKNEYKRVYKVFLDMKKNKQKTISSVKVKINSPILDKLGYVSKILNGKYILNKIIVSNNLKVDGKKYSDYEFLITIPSEIKRNLNLLAKETQLYEDNQNYLNFMIDFAKFKKTNEGVDYVVAETPSKEYLAIDLPNYTKDKSNQDYKVAYSTIPFTTSAKTKKEPLEKIEIKAIGDLIDAKGLKISLDEGKILYATYKNYKNMERDEHGLVAVTELVDIYEGNEPFNEEGEPISIYKLAESLSENGYLMEIYYLNETGFELQESGEKLIDQIEGRIETLKGVKYGYEMFPEIDNLSKDYSESKENIKKMKESVRNLLKLRSQETDENKKERYLKYLQKISKEISDLESKTFKIGGTIENEENDKKTNNTINKNNMIDENKLKELKQRLINISHRINEMNTIIDGDKSKEALRGGKADKMNEEDLAKKHGVSLSEINRRLAKGIKTESEHTSDTKIQREIALDHIAEMLDYYDRLEIMEKQAKIKNYFSTNKKFNESQKKSIHKYLKSKGLVDADYEIGDSGDIVFYVNTTTEFEKNFHNYLRNNLL